MTAAFEFQDDWDSAVQSSNRRLALRAMHAQLGLEDKDWSIDRGGAHDAPSPESGAPMWDVSRDIYPEDFYSPVGLRYYGTGDDRKDHQVYEKIKLLAGCPNKLVVVYRAVAADSDVKKILEGDWVSPIRSYATDHGKASLGGEFRILSKTVHARDLFTSGDSMLEWGFHPQPFKPELRTGWKEQGLAHYVLQHSQPCPGTKATDNNTLFAFKFAHENVSFSTLVEKLGTEDAMEVALAMSEDIEQQPEWKGQFAELYGGVQSLLASDPDALGMLQVYAAKVFNHPAAIKSSLAHGYIGAVRIYPSEGSAAGGQVIPFPGSYAAALEPYASFPDPICAAPSPI